MRVGYVVVGNCVELVDMVVVDEVVGVVVVAQLATIESAFSLRTASHAEVIVGSDEQVVRTLSSPVNAELMFCNRLVRPVLSCSLIVIFFSENPKPKTTQFLVLFDAACLTSTRVRATMLAS